MALSAFIDIVDFVSISGCAWPVNEPRYVCFCPLVQLCVELAEMPHTVDIRYIFPARKEFIDVFAGTSIVHIIEPPCRTKLGEHEVAVEFTPLIEESISGPSIGYCCEFVRKNAIVVLWVIVLVPIIMSLQYAPLTNVQLLLTMFDGTEV